MKIQYLGHSAFRLVSDFGMTVVCDPYSSDLVGYDMVKVSCDLVTVSHRHSDHDYVDGVSGDPTVADCKAEFLADDVCVKSLESFHDEVQGKKRGKNLVFVFTTGGLTVVHMGDIGEKNEALAETLSGADVLLVPVGGTYTVDAEGAKWYVDKIRPKIVIPMHYAQGGTINIDGVESFTRLFDEKQVYFPAADSIEAETCEGEEMKVIVLQRLAD